MDDTSRSDAPVVPRASHTVEASLNGQQEDSDIFVCRPLVSEMLEAKPAPVTLFVFGWHNVEPGPLSWPFPSLKTAMAAVKTMKNAAQWCIVSGSAWPSMDAARTSGAVLVEELG